MVWERLASWRADSPLTPSTDCGSFLVRVVSFLEDNFAYVIIDKSTGRTAIVDPGDGARCLAHVKDLQVQFDELRAARAESGGAPGVEQPGIGEDRRTLDRAMLGQVQNRPELTTALVTHHHLDHAGGIPALRDAVPELRVIAGQKEAVPHTNAPTTHGARVWLGATEIDVLAAPCHTRGHVLYHVHGPTAKRGGPPPPGAGARGFAGSGALFTGDTLFIGGCGRFFEGGAEDMHYVLYTVLRPLPPETPVFCGHEYTVENLKFALWIDAGNRDVQVRPAGVGWQWAPCSPRPTAAVRAGQAGVGAAHACRRAGNCPVAPLGGALLQPLHARAHALRQGRRCATARAGQCGAQTPDTPLHPCCSLGGNQGSPRDCRGGWGIGRAGRGACTRGSKGTQGRQGASNDAGRAADPRR